MPLKNPIYSFFDQNTVFVSSMPHSVFFGDADGVKSKGRGVDEVSGIMMYVFLLTILHDCIYLVATSESI